MLLLIPIIILLLVPVIMLALGRLQRPFRYFWLLAAGAAFLAWLSVWVLRIRLDAAFQLSQWRPLELFDQSPALAVDAFSWPFAIALSTITLAIILTDIGRAEEADWYSWASSLALAALGLVAILSANLITLVLAWTIIDVLEFLVLLPYLTSDQDRRNLVIHSFTNLLGTMFLLWASVSAQSLGLSFQFAFIPASVSVYVLLALGLRMGVLPLNVFFLQEPQLRRGLGTLLRMVSASASLVLLTRVAVAGVSSNWQWLLMLLALVAAWYASFAWLRANNELEGRPYWILGIASFAFAAAMRTQPGAVMAWGLALLLVGSLAFLASTREWRLALVGGLGLVGITTLPFTAAQNGAVLFASPFNVLSLGFLVPQAVLLLGFVRHGLRQSNTLEGVERWVRILYPIGLLLLPITHWAVSTVLLPELPSPATRLWWPGVAVLLLGGGLYGLSRVLPPIPVALFDALQYVFSFEWLFRLANAIFQLVSRLYAIPVMLFEGEAGLLWTLLFLALLFTLFTQLGIGA
ncbi:MAG: hypothetical protein DWQ07_22365 [Chloroflexi bacterium]|nr:MAG: hypothetical protein DWQ07_22365 [Chloroflexota bacterium]MBL1193893.1 hypothetical protein [Chloroflexota bacterium]NOH11187.1 hypothetical protein [Chloroflexota bacterium]